MTKFNKLIFIFRKPLRMIIILITKHIPYFSFLYKTLDYQNRINFGFWFKQKVLNIGGNKEAYWPVHWSSQVYDVENILIGVDAYPGIMKGCYIQGKGGITIGNYTQIAPNVIIVSANHDIHDSRKHILKPIKIGEYCWLGAGCKIMPGVELGDFTIVAAGAVVTRSFPDGYSLIGGMPAKNIKDLDRNECVRYKTKNDFFGYISSKDFANYRRKHLNV